jgi:hypothetical protein
LAYTTLGQTIKNPTVVAAIVAGIVSVVVGVITAVGTYLLVDQRAVVEKQLGLPRSEGKSMNAHR